MLVVLKRTFDVVEEPFQNYAALLTPHMPKGGLGNTQDTTVANNFAMTLSGAFAKLLTLKKKLYPNPNHGPFSLTAARVPFNPVNTFTTRPILVSFISSRHRLAIFFADYPNDHVGATHLA